MIPAMAEEAAAASPGAVSLTRPVSLLRHLGYVVRSMRPKQWTKNGIVGMAFLFSIHLAWEPDDFDSWSTLALRAAAAAAIFCLVSGADYLVNDTKDRVSDGLHPRKRYRPIAAGLLPAKAALTWAAVLWTAGVAAAFALDWRAGMVVVGYIVLMTAYTYILKYEVILDVMVIAAGFVLRAMAGAYAVDVPISPWLYVVTALGALFIAVTKRRAEVALLQGEAADHRSTLSLYTPALIDQMTAMVTSSTIIAYALYTFTAENLPANHTMMLTIPFVAYGIFRYLFLSLTRNEGGSPEEVLLKDLPLMVTVVGWVLTSMAVLAAYR
jgi:4-hydroxybenzoate polyprenyltransferase